VQRVSAQAHDSEQAPGNVDGVRPKQGLAGHVQEEQRLPQPVDDCLAKLGRVRRGCFVQFGQFSGGVGEDDAERHLPAYAKSGTPSGFPAWAWKSNLPTCASYHAARTRSTSR
jgi:hypothetical protein